jgi:hypothetical protein
MTRFEAIVLAIVAVIAIAVLLLPPQVGLADNGDFYKTLSKFGLDHKAETREDRYFGYVDMVYVPDAESAARHRQVWGGALISSEVMFMAGAVGLNRLLGFAPEFQLQVAGAVHIAVLLAGAALLLYGTRCAGMPGRAIGAILAVTMFLDVAYLCYFNSAYTETASFLFLLLLIGAAIPVMLGTAHNPLWILAYFVFSILFCASRYPNAAMFPLLALFGLLLAFRARKWPCSTVAAAATLAGCYFLAGFIREAPPAYTEFSAYNHFFNSLLPSSPAPAADLAEFGMDPGMLAYSGTTYYETGSAVYQPDHYRMFRETVTPGSLARFYLRHPPRIWAAMRRTATLGLTLRPGYGNYPKAAGFPPGAISRGFDIWSSVRESMLPKSVWTVLGILAAAVVVAVRPWRSLPVAGFRILLALLCILQLGMVACASDPSDVKRHMFLFNLLLDVTLMLAAIDLLFLLGERLVRTRKTGAEAGHAVPGGAQ